MFILVWPIASFQLVWEALQDVTLIILEVEIVSLFLFLQFSLLVKLFPDKTYFKVAAIVSLALSFYKPPLEEGGQLSQSKWSNLNFPDQKQKPRNFYLFTKLILKFIDYLLNIKALWIMHNFIEEKQGVLLTIY